MGQGGSGTALDSALMRWLAVEHIAICCWYWCLCCCWYSWLYRSACIKLDCCWAARASAIARSLKCRESWLSKADSCMANFDVWRDSKARLSWYIRSTLLERWCVSVSFSFQTINWVGLKGPARFGLYGRRERLDSTVCASSLTWGYEANGER